MEYSEDWRGIKPHLYRIARNHRSMKNIVYLANRLQKTMTRTIPLQMQTFREEDGEIKIKVACLPVDIANKIAAEIQKDAQKKRDPILYKENAILVRSAIQIRDLEGELVRRRIPYIVRGGRGFWQQKKYEIFWGICVWRLTVKILQLSLAAALSLDAVWGKWL